jgi:hypothetical protein
MQFARYTKICKSEKYAFNLKNGWKNKNINW